MHLRPRLLLTTQQWHQIEPHISGRQADPGRIGANNRRFVEAVCWILRTGAPWRDLPSFFGRWSTVYQRFRRWCLRGVWGRILRRLTPHGRAGQVLLIDSTIVRAHQHSTCWRGTYAARANGRSRGGLTTKLHVAVTPAWRLCWHAITPGQQADIRSVPRLLRQLSAGVGTVIGDRAYDSDAFVSQLARRGISAVIPPRRGRLHPRAWSRCAYQVRHGVENYFARLKHFRRLATRFDKRVPAYQGFFLMANILLQVESTLAHVKNCHASPLLQVA